MTKQVSAATRAFAFLALFYTVLGLFAGVAYRELTRGAEVAVQTQLSVVHTHVLVLGLVMSLLFMVIEAVFHLSAQKLFKAFLWVYNLSLLGIVVMMTVVGLRQLWGQPHSAAVAGISGLFHIGLTVGFGLFFAVLLKALRPAK